MQRPSLADLQEQARSDDANVRQQAMIGLSEIARKQPEKADTLRPIFRDAIEHPRDGWTVAHALRGLDRLSPDESRRSRLPFFEHPDADMACPAIVTAPDRSCVPALLAALENQQNPDIRKTILQVFARLRDPATVEPTIAYLQFPILRPHAIETLGYLGDPRAIPYLEQWRSDTTPTWPIDDRGPMMTVADMAGYAIERIHFFLRGGPSPQFTRPVAAPIAPPPIPRAAITSTWTTLAPFIPLAMAIATIPWVFIIVIFSLDHQGHVPIDPNRLRGLDILGAIPAAAGLFAGILITLRIRPLRAWQWILLAIGLLVCALAVFSFTWEFAHDRMV